ncbi:RTC domain containing 1 [Coprinopsis cinerea okayama7|uniref:RNA 3'-terminal-phosphate cyclase (ATP) n=1 Tax=Coprinopsis cinerea (strain Okayama-7 / 130 / ATCC MYA-4618 / FGSC 9003) TaxID=240176 RepID=A8NG59_COPC7|nr:RTC domain containing 1 [Coprinopsis cinerea okayama7\|eukprot:XP_001833484.1 RTC domain containing 1 [Coprinopsis cinerea okayama7\
MANPDTTEPIVLDGSVLEGGGQILRNAVALSALLHKPITIEKIRYGRSSPGLRNQHRTGLELAARIASAELLNAKNGSTSITFKPGSLVVPGEYIADAVTAGAVTLMLQISLPLLLFSSSIEGGRSTLTLRGGTNAIQAPQIDYVQHVFLPFVQRHFGVGSVDVNLTRRGYYPKGGGEVVFSLPSLPPGEKLKSFSLLQRGKLVSIKGIAHFSKLPGSVGSEMVRGAEKYLRKAGYRGKEENDMLPPNSDDEDEEDDGAVKIEIKAVREKNDISVAGGSGIVLWAELEGGGFIGGSAVGKKGIDPQQVGAEAAELLVKGLEGGGCVDEWLQDQIIIFMALADGSSEVRCARGELELHTKTAIWLAEQLTDAKFTIEADPAGTIIRCQGIGYSASPHQSERNAED